MIKTIRKSDVILALFVVAIAAMLLLPLSTTLLDILLVINISFAILLLVVGLYMPNALALLAFPSLLLLTTLFRLGLNVASTRLILSDGYAGEVIQAFGTFLIRGEVVVGVIIFTIITIVNFIVIARGSSRVSEVAARFALDALPGKQMAIDADLRAGLISTEEARVRRDDLRKESQLYGAMDGAMKFVQGDAVAGFFIIVTNIIGGMYIGISSGMGVGEAVDTYTRLTVGDGLVSQIPALLISICAGIVVTRVSSDERATLGSDVGEQLFSRPGSMIFSGCLLLLLGLLPGLPWFPFMLVGLSLLVAGVLLGRRASAEDTLLPALADGTTLITIESKEGETDSGVEVEVCLDPLLFSSYQTNAPRYEDFYRKLQRSLQEDLGLELPRVLVSRDPMLSTGGYVLRVAGSEAEVGSVPLDSVLVDLSSVSASLFGLDVSEEGEFPGGTPGAFWMENHAQKTKVLREGGIRYLDGIQYIYIKLAQFLQRNPEHILSVAQVHQSLRELERQYPGLLSEAIDQSFVGISKFVDVLHELVREKISIRDFRYIVELVSSYCASYGITRGNEEDFYLYDVVAFIRLNKKRSIVGAALSFRRTLRLISLSPEVEQVFEALRLRSPKTPLAIDPAVFESLQQGLQALIDPLKQRGVLPVSVVCQSEVRPKVSKFLRSLQQPVSTLAFDELDPAIRVEPLGTWSLEGV